MSKQSEIKEMLREADCINDQLARNLFSKKPDEEKKVSDISDLLYKGRLVFAEGFLKRVDREVTKKALYGTGKKLPKGIVSFMKK